jgi:hypothetical protein
MQHKINLEQANEFELMSYQIALMTVVSNINEELLRVKEKLAKVKKKEEK